MPVPHPLAAVAQHLVRERSQPPRRRRRAARRRPWSRSRSSASVQAAPVADLDLPPTLVLPAPRTSPEAETVPIQIQSR